MDRRTLLKAGGVGLFGLGFGGCAGRSTETAQPAAATIPLAPVKASWDRVIRTTVGLRPHRPSGFVVKAAKLDDKMVVHNYGHGGAGHSIGWGTGSLAADLADAQDARRAAVLGCGTVGLTAARQLQRRGYDVTIYTAAVPPYTTSNMAWAAFTPTSGLIGRGGRSPAWEAQFRAAVEIAYRELQLLAGRDEYGIAWLNSYSTLESLPKERTAPPRESQTAGLLPEYMRGSREILGPGEHPFPTAYASRRPRLRIEPSVYLDALMRDIRLFGAKIVLRKFDSPRDLMTLDEPLIVNCTALGSRELFGDEELTPVKGQLTFLVPQPEVDYGFGGSIDGPNGRVRASTNPRRDGIALSGAGNAPGEWSLTPNEDAVRQVVQGAISLSQAILAVPAGERMVTAAPRRPAPAVDDFFDRES
ncbi:MAG: FAD-dependent oxidoreductase [Vicinamibacterales bacterium]|jgi:glycine/D-amino acid oxidase-like deaminating enzyme|nr:FAD-dependent oxidoreductase [Vicinamibacterales bacterium]MDP7471264.1 FAD-dependent oxidoreductase [Vicinamibacterales bacterium]MDP7672471.1 FAD-dependent oxidoreductase [Vicinamibacterales bacterium]HJO37519.1 FAD-dependent oxidoreductase [Vicinamibacterales bacterium]